MRIARHNCNEHLLQRKGNTASIQAQALMIGEKRVQTARREQTRRYAFVLDRHAHQARLLAHYGKKVGRCLVLPTVVARASSTQMHNTLSTQSAAWTRAVERSKSVDGDESAEEEEEEEGNFERQDTIVRRDPNNNKSSSNGTVNGENSKTEAVINTVASVQPSRDFEFVQAMDKPARMSVTR